MVGTITSVCFAQMDHRHGSVSVSFINHESAIRSAQLSRQHVGPTLSPHFLFVSLEQLLFNKWITLTVISFPRLGLN